MSGCANPNYCPVLVPYLIDQLGGEIIESYSELQPGDILCYIHDDGETDLGHVDILGEEEGSGYVKYNGGSYADSSHPSIQSFDEAAYNSEYLCFGVRLFGSKKTESAPYEGYQGNEAVVSPVTGILLEYGTYEEDDKDNIVNDPERVNVDLKYGNLMTKGTEKIDDTNPGTNPDPSTTPQEIQADKVGYAKILVLNSAYYKALESQTDNRWKDDGVSLVNIREQQKEDDKTIKSYYSDYSGSDLILSDKKQLKDDNLDGDDSDAWTEIDKLVYGYKEFAETYEYAGIAGYVVYIDGFVCEEPDEEFTEEDLKEKVPYQDNTTAKEEAKISLDRYKEITESVISSDNDSDKEKMLESYYESPEEYKMASEKATKKLNAELEVKNQASSSIYIPNVKIDNETKDAIFIKEGTILGRTMTDRELIMEIREQDEEKLKEYRPSYFDKSELPESTGKDDEEPQDKVMGNYVRVIMRDLVDTAIENVEDYMKLDDGEKTQTGDQEYQFQEGDLDLLADAIHHEGCGSFCASLAGSSSEEDKLYMACSTGFTMINKLNSDSGYNHAAGWDWAPNKSQLYNLLCVVPCAAHGGKGWYAISDAGTLGGLKNRADQNQYEYCDICMQAAEYIKENDSLNFKNNGKFGSQYSSGEGMPHTCWEQGSGYDGKGKIWVYLSSANFYLFDTAN